MKKILLILLFTFFVSSIFATYYKVNITRKGSNLYQVQFTNIFIVTRYCYEYCYYEDAIYDDTHDLLIIGRTECDVVKIYRSDY